MRKIAKIAGKIPVKIKLKTDIENVFAAETPNNPNNPIRVASLVPNPLIVIGIRETIVPMGKIVKK